MTRVAFYAPMKPPGDPTPSGDREMARNLIAAIGARRAEVEVVSNLKLHEKSGNPERQADLRAAADAEVTRLSETLAGADLALWVTYHNYYKAPDLIGPATCAALGLPYVQIESTRAKKRLTGPWADFARAAEAACDTASVIFYLTANDLITLGRHRVPEQRLVHLPPFLPADTLPEPSRGTGAMLTAGMMREGDKLASYTILAEALAHVPGDWRLEIAGDGPARGQVAAMMAPYGDRVRFLGQLDRDTLARAYQRASLFVWPGVNEAFGMVYLEAQAFGLPVVAQDRPGVRDVLLPGTYPRPEDGPEALAAQIAALLSDPELRNRRGDEARAMIARAHLRPTATERFWSAVAPLVKGTP